MTRVTCRYCGGDRNLLLDSAKDEDGMWDSWPINLCEFCVEHHEERRKARAEWEYYHEEPCPEGELPQPGPKS
jgi:hypothetical protein